MTDEFSFEVAGTVPDNYNFTALLTMTTTDDYWYTHLDFTAHWINAFVIEQDSIDVLLALDQTTERTFIISNISEQTVNYYLQLDQGQRDRDISGSYISCDSTVFYPGTEENWIFTVLNNSSSNEWVSDVWLDFPPGINVTFAGAVYGGTGGAMIWNGTTGDGANVNWHGVTANDWGVLRDGETATWNVHVEIGDHFASDIQVGWQIGGDGYGAEPHLVSGELNYDFYITWISLNTSFGTLAAGGSEEITIYYDTHGMEIGDYGCVINILSDSWFAEEVETNLTVVAVGEGDDTITPATLITGICPKPFNPSTEIRFELAKNAFTELNVYNVRGQKVRTLLKEDIAAGEHKIIWDGRNNQNLNVGSGIYYLQLKSADTCLTRKMILMK
jgi:hypothetical protein